VSCGTTCRSLAGCGDGPRKNPPQRAEVPAPEHHRHDTGRTVGRGTSRSSPAAAYSRAVSLVCHTMVIGLPPLLRPSLLFGSNREAGGVRRACCRTRSSPLRRAILKSVAEAEVVPKDPRRRAHSRSQVVAGNIHPRGLPSSVFCNAANDASNKDADGAPPPRGPSSRTSAPARVQS